MGSLSFFVWHPSPDSSQRPDLLVSPCFAQFRSEQPPVSQGSQGPSLSASPEAATGARFQFSQSDSSVAVTRGLPAGRRSPPRSTSVSWCLPVILASHPCCVLRVSSPLLALGVPGTLPTCSLFGLRLPDLFCRSQSRTLTGINCVGLSKGKSSGSVVTLTGSPARRAAAHGPESQSALYTCQLLVRTLSTARSTALKLLYNSLL